MRDDFFVLSPTGRRVSANFALKSGAPRQGWRCATCRQSVHLRSTKNKKAVITHLNGDGSCAKKSGQNLAFAALHRALHALAQTWRLPVPAQYSRIRPPRWAAAEGVVERAALVTFANSGSAVLLVQTYVRVLALLVLNPKLSPQEGQAQERSAFSCAQTWRIAVLKVSAAGDQWADLTAAFDPKNAETSWEPGVPTEARRDDKWRTFDTLCREAALVHAKVENRQGSHYNLVVPQTLRQISQDMRAYALANKMPVRVTDVLLAWRTVPDTVDEHGQPLRVFERHIDTRPEQVTLAWLYFRACLHGLHSRELRWTETSMAAKLASDVLAQSRVELEDEEGDYEEAAHNMETILQPIETHGAGMTAKSALAVCVQLMLERGFLCRDDRSPDVLVSQVALR